MHIYALQPDVYELEKWCAANKLSLNIKKCHNCILTVTQPTTCDIPVRRPDCCNSENDKRHKMLNWNSQIISVTWHYTLIEQQNLFEELIKGFIMQVHFFTYFLRSLPLFWNMCMQYDHHSRINISTVIKKFNINSIFYKLKK